VILKNDQKHRFKKLLQLLKMNGISNQDLWDNPMVKKAMESMSPEQLEQYKMLGESMYGNIDFGNSKILNNPPVPVEEALAYVEESLKSGLHPSMLEEEEKIFLEDMYGNDWYKRFGYDRRDLTEIYTIKK
jgi:hypothetical protein